MTHPKCLKRWPNFLYQGYCKLVSYRWKRQRWHLATHLSWVSIASVFLLVVKRPLKFQQGIFTIASLAIFPRITTDTLYSPGEILLLRRNYAHSLVEILKQLLYSVNYDNPMKQYKRIWNSVKRLRWSRGSVLAFRTKGCGFEPAKKSSARLPSEG
jgi:hypothetical protein